ncbi:beta-glucosidase [Clostridium sp. 19966]|uniref:GH1 family beta-glucosidase n=1 Tax=Clostridium sp. 19966 TaxID=2768166 RepID=UPI0028DE24AC|nr:GH1 family beta-glucosidase [Clostridium sp. 19966]MDT8716182.1 beta-glucosidase [Clostridium sp. 19966]
MEFKFPKDFVWGTATASYQIEGAVKEDGRGESIWDRFSHIPGNVLNGDTGDIACDHYHRFEEDIDLMKSLGMKSYRFSIAWPRIFPNGFGKPNPKGIAFYKKIVALLIERGIKPAITLYHWDLPQKLQDIGGWTNPQVGDYFVEYCKYIFTELGDKVSTWITMNEPWVFTILSYERGEHAPGYKDTKAALTAAHNALVAHGKVVKAFREMSCRGEIGIVLNMGYKYPYNASEEALKAAETAHELENSWFSEPIFKGEYPKAPMAKYKELDLFPDIDVEELKIASEPIDFLGINYYSSAYIAKNNEDPYGICYKDGVQPKTEMGWMIIPEGLTDLLVKLSNDYNHVKIYITENGAAFNDIVSLDGTVKDTNRIDYLQRHFMAMHEAINKGVNLAGYYLWSFMDNFEWAFGYEKRFGIVHVDYATQKRTPKDSAKWYSEVIRNNGF